MFQNYPALVSRFLKISLKIRGFLRRHVPTAANFGTKNRVSQTRPCSKIQTPCRTTTYGRWVPKQSVPKFQNRFIIASLIILSSLAAQAAPAAEADILLKGGTIFDGAGGKPYEGNVAIKDGHIVAVGAAASAATAKQ